MNLINSINFFYPVNPVLRFPFYFILFLTQINYLSKSVSSVKSACLFLNFFPVNPVLYPVNPVFVLLLTFDFLLLTFVYCFVILLS